MEVRCEQEGCGNNFEMEVVDADARQQGGVPYLCPICEMKMLEAVASGESKRLFQYDIIHVCRQNPQRPDLMEAEWERKLVKLNDAGHSGWEAVAVVFDGVVLLKREYFE